MSKDLIKSLPIDLSKPRDAVGEIKQMMSDVLHEDLSDVLLKRYAFWSDESLAGEGFTAPQIRRIREWEKPRKEIAFGMQASHERVTAMLRREEPADKRTINIENLVLRLPEKNPAPATEVTYVEVKGQEE